MGGKAQNKFYAIIYFVLIWHMNKEVLILNIKNIETDTDIFYVVKDKFQLTTANASATPFVKFFHPYTFHVLKMSTCMLMVLCDTFLSYR